MDISPDLLSKICNWIFSAGVNPVKIMHGTRSSFNFCAANNRPCPAIIVLFSSTIIGLVHAVSIDRHNFSICSAEWSLGFSGSGLISATFKITISKDSNCFCIFSETFSILFFLFVNHCPYIFGKPVNLTGKPTFQTPLTRISSRLA